MRWVKRLAGTALIAVSLPAAAETLYSSPLYGSYASTKFAVCYLFNSGTTPIRVIGFRLWYSETNKSLLSKGDCPKYLPAFHTCQAVFPTTYDGGAYSCRLELGGTANPNARGSVELRSGDAMKVNNRADIR